MCGLTIPECDIMLTEVAKLPNGNVDKGHMEADFLELAPLVGGVLKENQKDNCPFLRGPLEKDTPSCASWSFSESQWNRGGILRTAKEVSTGPFEIPSKGGYRQGP